MSMNDGGISHAAVMRQRDSEERARLDGLAKRLASTEKERDEAKAEAKECGRLNLEARREWADAVSETDRLRNLLEQMHDAVLNVNDPEWRNAWRKEIEEVVSALAAPGPSTHLENPNSSPAPAPIAWTTEPPSIPKGEAVAVIVAKFSAHTNRHYIFGAWYLNEFPIDDGEEGPALWTGFHEASRYSDYDCCYAPLVGVTHWMPMPAGPVLEPAQPGEAGESRSVEAENSELRDVLISARSELCRWERLAKYHREMRDQDLGWWPTQSRIDASAAVRGQISSVLARLPIPEPREE